MRELTELKTVAQILALGYNNLVMIECSSLWVYKGRIEVNEVVLSSDNDNSINFYFYPIIATEPQIIFSDNPILIEYDLGNMYPKIYKIEKRSEIMNTPTTHQSLTCDKMTMPIINSHTFKNGRTTIQWNDGTTTSVACDPQKADVYTGFMIAVAKKAYGNDNTINNLADKWLVKIPKQEAERKAKEEAKKAEQERIAANKARKKEIKHRKKLIRDGAKKFKEMYEKNKLQEEIMKTAIEQYGIPEEWFFDTKER